MMPWVPEGDMMIFLFSFDVSSINSRGGDTFRGSFLCFADLKLLRSLPLIGPESRRIFVLVLVLFGLV